MDVDYIAQPDIQLGTTLSKMLDSDSWAPRIVVVSAFVGLQTIMRIKHQVADRRASGTEIRFVLGIDFQETSREVLEELLAWDIDVRIAKHRRPGHTFHPKLFLFEWEHEATIIVGSNNLTDGGFFGNYEAAVRVTYRLPADAEQFSTACAELRRFLDPEGPTVYRLSSEFLADLVARHAIPTEREARLGRDVPTESNQARRLKGDLLFGTEEIAPPPPLPEHALKHFVAKANAQRRSRRSPEAQRKGDLVVAEAAAADDSQADPLLPAAFYMTLPTLQGPTIPGEPRIPLVALELAKEFWGWPHEYTEEVKPKSKRAYWNWRPKWRISSLDDPDNISVQEVRMYMYPSSSDFRFYARPLLNAGADQGDIVRLRRVSDPDGVEYECVLARSGTVDHAQWLNYCTQRVQNSSRRFGYA